MSTKQVVRSRPSCGCEAYPFCEHVANAVPRPLTNEEQLAIDELAARFFEGSGDMMAVSWSIRNVILARREWVAKRGKDAGE